MLLSNVRDVVAYSRRWRSRRRRVWRVDGLLNANPIAQRLYEAYRPIARTSVNAPLGLAFDLIAGVTMAALFVLLAPALPGRPVVKGLVFGPIAWFFRVAMGAAAQMVMFNVPAATLAYTLVAGLLEMPILGVIYGLALRPR